MAGAPFYSALLGSALGQDPLGSPPQDPNHRNEEQPAPPSKSGYKAILQANEKDIKKKVEKLYDLACDLKAEVEKTNSAEVLSLAMVKKAEEIEKLARDIKARAKG